MHTPHIKYESCMCRYLLTHTTIKMNSSNGRVCMGQKLENFTTVNKDMGLILYIFEVCKAVCNVVWRSEWKVLVF